MHMRHIAISGLSGSYYVFPYYLMNVTIFGKKKILNVKCLFWFSLNVLSETFLILRITERDMFWDVQ